MLNPSLADETRTDPTTTRCIRYAKSWGYGAHWAINLFAFVSPYPKIMFSSSDPVGPENNFRLKQFSTLAKNLHGPIVLAWGASPKSIERAEYVLELLRRSNINPSILGLTKNGNPRHPLYMSKSTILKNYPI